LKEDEEGIYNVSDMYCFIPDRPEAFV